MSTRCWPARLTLQSLSLELSRPAPKTRLPQPTAAKGTDRKVEPPVGESFVVMFEKQFARMRRENTAYSSPQADQSEVDRALQSARRSRLRRLLGRLRQEPSALSTTSAAPPCRSYVRYLLERARERRLGFVADGAGHRAHRRGAGGQPTSRQLDAPLRQVGHRRVADEGREAFGEHRPGRPDLPGELRQSPPPCRLSMETRERATHDRISQSAKPRCPVVRRVAR
jgi:hypothetical protein